MLPDELSHGRTQQKLRTRNALIAAARELIAEGRSPTVEDAAEAAAISRTTAYRYFKNQAELLAAAYPEIHVASFLPEDPPADVEARLDIVVKKLTKGIVASEAQYRTVLRLSLEEGRDKSSLFLRQGRAVKWLEEALEPARATLGKGPLR